MSDTTDLTTIINTARQDLVKAAAPKDYISSFLSWANALQGIVQDHIWMMRAVNDVKGITSKEKNERVSKVVSGGLVAIRKATDSTSINSQIMAVTGALKSLERKLLKADHFPASNSKVKKLKSIINFLSDAAYYHDEITDAARKTLLQL